MRFSLSLLFLLLSLLFVSQAQAAEPVTRLGVVLLQPSGVVESRVPGVDAMADYIQAVEAAARQAVQDSAARQSVSGFLVVAVRPGQRSKVWLDFDTLVDLGLQRDIAARMQAVKPFDAKDGPVVFAVKVALWGAKPSKRQVPLPAEWRSGRAEGAAPEEVEALVERLWPRE
jgi:hypothetical protein